MQKFLLISFYCIAVVGSLLSLIRIIWLPFHYDAMEDTQVIHYCLITCIVVTNLRITQIILNFILLRHHNKRASNYSLSEIPVWALIAVLDGMRTLSFYYDRESFIIPSLFCARRIIICTFLLTVLQTYLLFSHLSFYVSLLFLFCCSQALSSFQTNYSSPYLFYVQIAVQVIFGLLLLFILSKQMYHKEKMENILNNQNHQIQIIEKKKIILKFSIISIAGIYMLYSNTTPAFLSIYSSQYFQTADYSISIMFLLSVTVLNDHVLHFQQMLQQTKELKMMKSTLARYLSHQIRTPLNSVVLGLTCLTSVLSKITTPEVSDALDLLKDSYNSCMTATTILENIVMYETLSSGNFQIHPKYVNVPDFLDAAIAPFHGKAQNKGINFSRHVNVCDEIDDVSHLTVCIDPLRMTTALHCLLSNAFKYCKKGGNVRVEVEYFMGNIKMRRGSKSSASPIKVHSNVSQNSTGAVSKTLGTGFGFRIGERLGGKDGSKGGSLRVMIIDDGRGLEPETLHDLFERTIRFTTGDEEGLQGSGLSLWIANRLVNLHEGCTMEVRSDGKDQGCCFILTIPLSFHHISEKEAFKHKYRRRKGRVGPSVFPEMGSCASPLAYLDNILEETPTYGMNLIGREFRKLVSRSMSQENLDMFDDIGNKYESSDRTSASQDNRRMGNRDIISSQEEISSAGVITPNLSRNDNHSHGDLIRAHSDFESQNKSDDLGLHDKPFVDILNDDRQSLDDRLIPNNTNPTKTLESLGDDLSGKGIEEHNYLNDVDPEDNDEDDIKSVTTVPHNFDFEISPGLSSKEMIFSSLMDPAENQYHILVVDDAPINLKMITRILRERFQRIEQAEDGAVAVDCVKHAMSAGCPFDFILMDYQMPNMDGATAAKVMREIGYKGPIIGITGNAVGEDIETFLSNGANAVLTKPLDLFALEECLAEHYIVLDTLQS